MWREALLHRREWSDSWAPLPDPVTCGSTAIGLGMATTGAGSVDRGYARHVRARYGCEASGGTRETGIAFIKGIGG